MADLNNGRLGSPNRRGAPISERDAGGIVDDHTISLTKWRQ